MGNIGDLNNSLMKVLVELVKDKNLCKLLYYTDSDPLSQADITNPNSLIRTNIIPKPFIDKVITEQTSFLLVTFDNFNYSRGGAYQSGKIIFNAICHKDLWEIKGGLRPYAILDEVDKVFDGKKIVGIEREINKESFRTFYVNDDFKGYTSIFGFTDFVR